MPLGIGHRPCYCPIPKGMGVSGCHHTSHLMAGYHITSLWDVLVRMRKYFSLFYGLLSVQSVQSVVKRQFVEIHVQFVVIRVRKSKYKSARKSKLMI